MRNDDGRRADPPTGTLADPALDRRPAGRSVVAGPGVVRNHPVRWALATGGLATILALAGTGVAGVAGATSGSATGASGGPPAQNGMAPAGGAMVTSVSGDTIVLKKANSTTETVTTTSSTVYLKGRTTTTASAVKAGELVIVTTSSTGGTLTATKITILGSGPKGGPPGAKRSGSPPKGGPPAA